VPLLPQISDLTWNSLDDAVEITHHGPATATAKMLIPKADRKKIHESLFREGVLVAPKK
jgi:hypothetical protein